MSIPKHIGQNIRNIRLLRGMKQATFAKELGIAQQNVSKMEKKEKLTSEKLKAAAEIFGVTVDAIENFNEKVQLNNNFALEENSGQIIHPVKDVIDYFKEELSKRDKKIEELQAELNKYKNKSKSTKTDDHSLNLRSVGVKGKSAAG